MAGRKKIGWIVDLVLVAAIIVTLIIITILRVRGV
jgi:hypothetical protein